MIPKFDTQTVLELACAAHRINSGYLKDNESVFDKDGKFMFIKHDNKTLVKFALGLHKQIDHEPEFAIRSIQITEQDKITAEEIKKYFRRLMFSAIKGDNEFQTEVNTILSEDQVSGNKIGYVACLPSVYLRDRTRNTFEKRCKDLEDGYIADKDTWINNKDCEILQCIRSKNFEAYNVDAIIDNKLVSWFAKFELKQGPAVIIKGKVKDHSNNWQTKKSTTRLNYVKVAQ